MYGHRARIGYIAPLLLVEIYPYEFYKMAPDGVTLILSTQTLVESTREEYEENFKMSARLAREMAAVGASIIVLGGATPAYSVGWDRVRALLADVEQECGVPVTTALDAQIAALRAVGAKKLAVLTPAGTGDREHVEREGFEIVGQRGGGYKLRDFGQLPLDTPAVLGRELIRQHPDADTLFFPAAHWPATGNVEALEQELGINVIASGQAILWHALRSCGIDDKVEGFGRLFRER